MLNKHSPNLTSIPTGTNPAARPALLESSRRLDWRFLLPEPVLGRVAYLGPESGQLLDSLRKFSTVLTCLEQSALPNETFDLVVVKSPSTARIQAASVLAAPGGRLYVESHGLAARKRAMGSRALVRQAIAAGFHSVEWFWHWPNFDSCTKFVPLHQPGAVALALTAAGIPGWASGVIARAAGPVALAGLVPSFSLMAEKARA